MTHVFEFFEDWALLQEKERKPIAGNYYLSCVSKAKEFHSGFPASSLLTNW